MNNFTENNNNENYIDKKSEEPVSYMRGRVVSDSMIQTNIQNQEFNWNTTQITNSLCINNDFKMNTNKNESHKSPVNMLYGHCSNFNINNNTFDVYFKIDNTTIHYKNIKLTSYCEIPLDLLKRKLISEKNLDKYTTQILKFLSPKVLNDPNYNNMFWENDRQNLNNSLQLNIESEKDPLVYDQLQNPSFFYPDQQKLLHKASM